MSRKSLFLACVIAAVPAVARDGSGPLLPPPWASFAPSPSSAMVARAAPVELDGLMALLAGLAVALGVAWRRL